MSILNNPLSEINDTILENKGYHRVTFGSPKFVVNSDDASAIEFCGAQWGPEQVAWEKVIWKTMIDDLSRHVNIISVITYFPSVFDIPVSGISDIGVKPANNAIITITKNNKAIWKVIRPVNDIGDLDVIQVELVEKLKHIESQFENDATLLFSTFYNRYRDRDDLYQNDLYQNDLYYTDKQVWQGIQLNINKQAPEFKDYFIFKTNL